jgi:ubiquinone/menaquinone biosynthesis C-methylase UbiE
MKKLSLACLFIVLLLSNSYSQKKERPYRCGFVTKDSSELRKNYLEFWNYINAKPGERIASVGCGNGYVEAQIAAFNDNIEWTLQDIDTICLNKTEWAQVLSHHERLKGKPISGTFILLRGEEHITNLKRNYYDRIMMINTYHELSDQKGILIDVKGALQENGLLVIMERMAKRKNEKRKDCGHVMPWEPEMYQKLESHGFKLVQKVNTKGSLTSYTFKPI